jgi:CRP-like cAMP-binding protein
VEIGNKTMAQLAEELRQIPFLEELKPEQLLDQIPFFEQLEGQTRQKVAEEALLLQFQPGQEVCHQGDYEETFYIILSGEVEVSTETQAHKSIHLAVLCRGEFFGEMGPLSGQPRTATITARERTVVLQLSKTLFLNLLRHAPVIKKKIDQKYIERSLRTHLRQVALLSSLPSSALEELTGMVELVSFRKGEVIIWEGDVGDCLYLIRSGFVKVSRGPLDREKILTYLREGNYFGEMALVRDERRTANVVAMTDVEAVRIDKEQFQEIARKSPEVQAEIQKTMTAREAGSVEIGKDQRLAKAMSFVVQKGLAQAREILVVDLERCIGCNNCVLACGAVRGHPRIERRGSRLGKFLVPTSCFHCENPECLLCPVGGIVRDKSGEIHHTEFCNGCGGCARRCPFGNILAIKLPAAAGEEPAPGRRRRSPQLMVKCDMCRDSGRMACVYNCPTGAMQALTPEDLIDAYEE